MKKNTLYSVIPNHETVLSLEPEELAGVVLELLNLEGRQKINRYNFTIISNFLDYPEEHRFRIRQAVTEAWVWLEREGLIIPHFDETGRDWCLISRRGKRLETRTDLEDYRKSQILPKEQLHSVIALKTWSAFLRGDYDTAIFQAFKEVEIAVRDAGGYSASDIGVPLVRKAFHPDTGKLTDYTSDGGEKQAMSDLFAGAIGSFKSPGSHRGVTVAAEDAAEIIMFASQLMRIVDSRKP
jgi:uncharacterized protein (TIGR02391 family)